MSWLGGFLPTTLIIPFLIYTFFSHEVAEWAYERGRGLQGSSVTFGFFVDATAAIGQFGLYVLLIAYAYDQGWRRALGLYVITLLAGVADQIVPILIKRKLAVGFILFRIASVSVVYIALFYICYRLSWFGLRVAIG